MAATFTFYWEESPRIIEVDLPDTSVTVQEIVDAIRDEEQQSWNIDNPHLLDAEGKYALGAGVTTGIVARLLNALIRFADRPGPGTVQCLVSEGTLITDVGPNPIAPSAYTHVVVLNEVGGVIATSSGDVDAIAAGVWNKQESQIVAVGSIGVKVKTNLDETVSSRKEETGEIK